MSKKLRRDIDTYQEALLRPSPAPPAENYSLTHSELLFVIRAAEQWSRDAALTFSKVVPLNLSISTCLHAWYGVCHIHQSQIPGEGKPASKKGMGGEAQAILPKDPGIKGGRVVFAWNPECFTEDANLKHAASLLTTVYINRAIFSRSFPLLIIAQNTPSKIHTRNNPL